MVAVSDFSGLVSSIWALARAAAMAPIVSLERCIGHLQLHEVKADGTRLRAFGTQPVADRLFDVLRDQLLQLGFRVFVREEGRPGTAEAACELCPAVGCTHIDDTDRREPRPGRLDPEQSGL